MDSSFRRMLELDYLCNEKRGPVIRKVLEVEASLMVEEYLRIHLPPQQTPLKDVTFIYSKGARVFLVDDVGVMLKGTIEYNGMPDVHVGFWDKILRGREAMAREVALIVAEDAGAHGVWTAVPETSHATLAFAKRVGFKEHQSTAGVVLLTLAGYIV